MAAALPKCWMACTSTISGTTVTTITPGFITLATVANGQVAQTAAADGAGYGRITDQADDGDGRAEDQTGQRLGG